MSKSAGPWAVPSWIPAAPAPLNSRVQRGFGVWQSPEVPQQAGNPPTAAMQPASPSPRPAPSRFWFPRPGLSWGGMARPGHFAFPSLPPARCGAAYSARKTCFCCWLSNFSRAETRAGDKALKTSGSPSLPPLPALPRGTAAAPVFFCTVPPAPVASATSLCPPAMTVGGCRAEGSPPPPAHAFAQSKALAFPLTTQPTPFPAVTGSLLPPHPLCLLPRRSCLSTF